MSAPLEIRGLSISSDARTIVSAVDLSVGAGETLGLVGESGSGKSLTSRAALGLLPAGLAAAGSITVSGTEILGASERTLRRVRGRRIGLLMQDPFAILNPLRSVREHLLESSPRRLSRAEITERLREVGIREESVADRYPFQLSGGMRQRIALAAALVPDPEVLIADEACTALDMTTQFEILELLRSIQEHRGMGVLHITHDLRIAFAVCDRVAVMQAGRIIESGKATDVARAPREPYTARLLASIPSTSATPPTAPTTQAGPSALKISGARKAFGSQVALGGVDLTIGRGESVGLVGESGSGKTTLARAVLGLVQLDAGEIDVDTHRIVPIARRRSRGDGSHRLVQCVFQDPSTSLNPKKTVGATLREALRQAPDGERSTVPALLSLVGLPEEYARRRPALLSGGERQRVAIARALALRPLLLVCDEPTASLDVTVQARILDLLMTVRDELGTSILFVTHDLAVVRQVTDHVAVLYQGEIVETGPTAVVLDHPQHEYTRRLIGSVLPSPSSDRSFTNA